MADSLQLGRGAKLTKGRIKARKPVELSGKKYKKQYERGKRYLNRVSRKHVQIDVRSFEGKSSAAAESVQNEAKTGTAELQPTSAPDPVEENEKVTTKMGRPSDVGSTRVVVTVTNLGGANGARLNGDELAPYKARVMQLGDKLQFGCSHLIFVLEQVNHQWKDMPTDSRSSAAESHAESNSPSGESKNSVHNDLPEPSNESLASKHLATPLKGHSQGESKTVDRKVVGANDDDEDEEDEDEDDYESADYFHVSSSDSEDDDDASASLRLVSSKALPDIKSVDVAWTVWRPQLTTGKHSGFFGDVLSTSNEEPRNECVVATITESEYLGLVRPVGFTLVAGTRQQPSLGKASDMIYMWLPTPPTDEHVAIGCVCTTQAAYTPPVDPGQLLLEQLHCVPLSLVACVMPTGKSSQVAFREIRLTKDAHNLDKASQTEKNIIQATESKDASSSSATMNSAAYHKHLEPSPFAIRGAMKAFEKCLGSKIVPDPSPNGGRGAGGKPCFRLIIAPGSGKGTPKSDSVEFRKDATLAQIGITVPTPRGGSREFGPFNMVSPGESFNTWIVPELLAKRGKYYYELVVNNKDFRRVPQIGVAQPGSTFTTNDRGVGDDAMSWAVDGGRRASWHTPHAQGNAPKQSWNDSVPKWNKGDIIGIALDLDEGTFSVFTTRENNELEENNIDHGVGFRNQDFVGKNKGIYPALTFAKGSCSVYFGGDPRGAEDAVGASMLGFRCPPPKGYLPWTMVLVDEDGNGSKSNGTFPEDEDEGGLVTLSSLAKSVRKRGGVSSDATIALDRQSTSIFTAGYLSKASSISSDAGVIDDSLPKFGESKASSSSSGTRSRRKIRLRKKRVVNRTGRSPLLNAAAIAPSSLSSMAPISFTTPRSVTSGQFSFSSAQPNAAAEVEPGPRPSFSFGSSVAQSESSAAAMFGGVQSAAFGAAQRGAFGVAHPATFGEARFGSNVFGAFDSANSGAAGPAAEAAPAEVVPAEAAPAEAAPAESSTCRSSTCRSSTCRSSTCRSSTCRSSTCRSSICSSTCRSSTCRSSTHRSSTRRSNTRRSNTCRSSTRRSSTRRSSTRRSSTRGTRGGSIGGTHSSHGSHLTRIDSGCSG